MLSAIFWSIFYLSVIIMVASFYKMFIYKHTIPFSFFAPAAVVSFIALVALGIVPVRETVDTISVSKSAVEKNGHFKTVLMEDGFTHLFYKKAFIETDDFNSYRKTKYNSFGWAVEKIYWFETK